VQGSTVTIYANAVINYHCKDKPTKALNVGVKMAMGTYKA